MSEERRTIEQVHTRISTVSITESGIGIIRFIEQYIVEPEDIDELEKKCRELNPNHFTRVLVVPGRY